MSFNISNQIPSLRRKRRQHLFSRDIEQLLFSLGDGPYSSEQTVNALEDTLTLYLTSLCHAALKHARAQGRNRIKIDDLPFALRNDPYKLSRLEYIINQSQRIEKAKKIFDNNVVSHLQTFNEDDDDDQLEGNSGKSQQNPKPRRKKRKQVPDVKQAEHSDDDDDDDGDNSA